MKKIFVSLLIPLLFASSCCDKSEETGRFLLTDKEKGFIPYEKGDSILFVHSGGNNFYMDVTHKYSNLTQTIAEHCGENYIVYEYLVAELSSITPQLYFALQVEPAEFNPLMKIEVNGYAFTLDVNSEATIDSVKFFGKKYVDVYSLETDMYDNPEIRPSRLLFNKEYGILQIKFTNNDSITIKN